LMIEFGSPRRFNVVAVNRRWCIHASAVLSFVKTDDLASSVLRCKLLPVDLQVEVCLCASYKMLRCELCDMIHAMVVETSL
jgi:hypothetical protein